MKNILGMAGLCLFVFMAQQITTTSTPYMTGQTGSCGGSLLVLGATSSCTATITGAAAGSPCEASPSDGTNFLVSGMTVSCTVTSTNTATVTLYAIISLTPTAKTYNVRVFP